MKEFIDKLIERLEELYQPCYLCREDKCAIDRAISIVNELAEEYKNDKVNQLAMMYAKNIYVYGVDVTKEWVSAVQNHMALEKAYVRGRQDEADRFAEEYKVSEMPTGSEDFCEWRLIDYEANVYDTTCRNPHILLEGSPTDNSYEFCPYCGKKIKVAPYTEGE